MVAPRSLCSSNEKLQPTCTACMLPLSARVLQYCLSSSQPPQHISVVVDLLRAHASTGHATLRQPQAEDGAPPTHSICGKCWPHHTPTQPICGKCWPHHATPTTDRSCCHSHAVGADAPCKCWPHHATPRQRQTHARCCNSHHGAVNVSDTSGTMRARMWHHAGQTGHGCGGGRSHAVDSLSLISK
jgi:hypothetical protein